MSNTGAVLQFPDPKQKRSSAASETGLEPISSSTQAQDEDIATVRVQGTAALAPIPIDVLYPPADSSRPALVKALRLLAESVATLEHARDALAANDHLQSDHDTQRVEALLPELFRCRTIGDGYAAIINALEIACINRRGDPLTAKQIFTFLRVLKGLRSHPFVSFDLAQQSLQELEQAGLCVDPVTLGDLLDDEQ
jgi:hypothetical protein